MRRDTAPPEATLSEFEKTKLFTIMLYKVVTTVSTDTETSLMLTAIIDTRAGPNLVQEDFFPTP